MIELLESFEPLIKLFESKTRRIIFAVILLIILTTVISDSLDGAVDSMLTPPLTALSMSGCGLFLGIGLLCVLPDTAPPHMRQGWYVFAIIATVGGVIPPLLFLIGLVRVILSLP